MKQLVDESMNNRNTSWIESTDWLCSGKYGEEEKFEDQLFDICSQMASGMVLFDDCLALTIIYFLLVDCWKNSFSASFSLLDAFVLVQTRTSISEMKVAE